MVAELFQVIHETPELLVIIKPAGLVCHPTKADESSSLISRVRLYLGESSHPQLVNRLDRETSGVTLVAKTATAARQLRHLWETRAVEKVYLAIVHGHVEQQQGAIEAPLGKDERSRVAIKDCVRPDGAPARTDFWVENQTGRQLQSVHVGTRTFPPPVLGSAFFLCYASDCTPGENTKFAFTWRISVIRSWGTSSMAATKIYIWHWSRTDSARSNGAG